VLVLRRPAERGTEYLFISLWDSSDAIARFAGPDIDKAVYYPEDRRYLLELEPGVAHYEVAATAGRSLFAERPRPGAGGG
jgi:heme-degrading monooxygenase HmoA